MLFFKEETQQETGFQERKTTTVRIEKGFELKTATVQIENATVQNVSSKRKPQTVQI
jgi:hypothetical protein